MNRGAQMLADSGLSSGALGSLLAERGVNVSRQACHLWAKGKRLPGLDARDALAQAPPGIAPTAWDEQPPPPAANAPQAPASPEREGIAAPPVASSDTPNAVELQRDLVTRIQRWRNEAEYGANTSPAARAQLVTLEQRAIRELARLTGQDAPEADLLRSRQWALVSDGIVEALVKFPDAARAVKEVLRAIERGSR